MEEMLIGVTDRTILVYIADPASTDGSGKTGLVAANLTVGYTRAETDNDVVHVNATGSLSDLSALTDAHADWGWKEVDSSLVPGVYRLDLADAVFATGAWYAVVYVMITTSAASATPKAFRLVAVNALSTTAPAGSINAAAFDADVDVYTANIEVTLDTAGDEYTATWFKNGVRQTSGITSPTIQVVKRVDGTDLVASTAMTQIGTTGSYKYDEATNQVSVGEATLVVVAATINSGSRSFSKIVTRDV